MITVKARFDGQVFVPESPVALPLWYSQTAMILLDTGYLLALANPRDELHERSVRWSQAISEPLLLTEYVLCEVVDALSLPKDRAKAHALVSELREADDCEIAASLPELFESGLRMHAARTDQAWSLTDCISFAIMEERKLSRALAHDHHFEQDGYEALLRRDPP